MLCYRLEVSISYLIIIFFFENFSRTVIFGPFLGPFRACKGPIGPEGSSNYMLKVEVYHMHK